MNDRAATYEFQEVHGKLTKAMRDAALAAMEEELQLKLLQALLRPRYRDIQERRRKGHER